MTTLEVFRPQGTLRVRTTGRGRPVVMSPGLGDLAGSYDLLAAQLVDGGHAVYQIDLRGHGESDVTFTDYAPVDIGDDIVALLEQHDLKDAVLVGNSISGAAVAWAALQAPERVSALVMLNPFVRDMPADRWMRPLVPLIFARPWGAWAWATYYRTLFKTPPADLEVRVAAARANVQQPERLAAVRGMLRGSKGPVAARLSELTVPSLVVMGGDDPDYADPAAEGQTVSGLLGGAVQVECLEGVGHYPQAEAPELTAAAMKRFLQDAATHAA